MSATAIESATADHWALGEIEPALANLKALAGIVDHIATADNEATPGELAFLAARLLEAHGTIEGLWKQAWEERNAERREHEAALKAAEDRAKQAAPGSVQQIKAVRAMVNMVRAGHRAAVMHCDEIADAADAALAERKVEAPA